MDTVDLFQEKQKYMYAVFGKTLLTDTGRNLIREHEEKFDTQEIYKNLVETNLNSTKALLDSSHILLYRTLPRRKSETEDGEALHTASYYTGKNKSVFTTTSNVRLPINFRKRRKSQCFRTLYTVSRSCVL